MMNAMQSFAIQTKSRGFTLIELLVTITIIGILATVGLRSFMGAQTKSRDAKRKSDLAAIQKALEVYYNDFGQYPASQGGLIRGCGDADDAPAAHVTCGWGTPFAIGDTSLMQELPDDPKGSYYYMSTGASYLLFARLENVDDAAVPVYTDDGVSEPGRYREIGGYGSVQTPTCRTSGNTTCNYVVTSSNTRVDSSYVLPDN